MKTFLRLRTLTRLLIGLAVAIPGHGPLTAQEGAAPKSRAWTLDEAMQQLRLSPQDAYLQYVALQLGHREGVWKAEEIGSQIDRLVRGVEAFPAGNERVGRVDLFSLFSGALAVQESLQLDAMRGRRPQTRRRFEPQRPTRAPPATKEADRPPVAAAPPPQQPGFAAGAPREAEPIVREFRQRGEKVLISALTGPTIKSHPWKEMLAGKKPDIGSMAKCVPEDFYLIEFRSLVKMLEVMDRSDLWGTHLFNQSVQEARTQLVAERLKKQLAVETNDLLRPFYDAVVEEVAVTGSDLYLREGSDVTLLFRSKQPEVLKARMDGFLATAANAGAKSNVGEFLGVAFAHVATPDRSVHVFSAYPTPELHVRSNSRVGFERVIEAIQGKAADGRAIRRLGDADEFAYIRSLMPRGAKEEDGFVYLSDPFIRRLVGPQLKLTERRRMVCYNHLRMIGHASLMYRTEFGKRPDSLEQLAQAKCSPDVFGQREFPCPEGGKYSLSADGLTGVCSHHGDAHSLTPCCEIPVQEVTREEADEYRAFLEEYNRYWRTFFDPIALRIQATPKRYRLETIVLPLIDNSIYTGLARALGGKPEALDALPVPQRNIFSLAVQLDKRELLRSAGMEELLAADAENRPDPTTQKVVNDLRTLGLALHNFAAAWNQFPGVAGDPPKAKGKLSWRVHILPYMEQEPLYKQFKLDEPWDSEHNTKLIARIPSAYRPSNPKLIAEGRTRIVAPVGPGMIFKPDSPGGKFAEVLDGLSNTFLLVEADDDHAVIWTKPDDLNVDLKKPLDGLAVRAPGAVLALIGDGSTRFIRKTADLNTVSAMYTRGGGETAMLQPHEVVEDRFSPRHRGPGLAPEIVQQLKLGEVLSKGIGNQIGLHVCDAEPTFDFSLPQFLGMAMGSFDGRRPFGVGGEGMMIGVLAAALNAPVYVSAPVRDARVVDDFLARLDGFLNVVARERENVVGFLRIEQDYYQMPGAKGKNIRAYGFRFGPLKWRFFWARIGDGLYVASKGFILDDLLASAEGREPARTDKGPEAHGMIRMRPQHWKRVLDDYRLGWAENNREACLNNVGPLSSLSRSLPGVSADEFGKELHRLSGRLYGAHLFCPEEGRYTPAPDGKSVICTVHGSATAPKQPAAPSETSSLGKLLNEFSEMTLSLTFLEDGLHAVVTIDRK